MLGPSIQNPWLQYIGHGNRTRHNLPCRRMQGGVQDPRTHRFATTFRRGTRSWYRQQQVGPVFCS